MRCQTSWVLKQAPALGTMPLKLGLCSLWVALMFESLNVDFLTLDLEITDVLFLALIITEICSTEVLTIHLALQLKFETVKLGPLGQLLYLDSRFVSRR